MIALTKRPAGGISRPHFLHFDDSRRKAFEPQARTTETPRRAQAALLSASYSTVYLAKSARKLSHSVFVSMNRWKVAWLHNFRRTVIRWEYYPENFLGMVQLACAIILLRHL
jgi:transposase